MRKLIFLLVLILSAFVVSSALGDKTVILREGGIPPATETISGRIEIATDEEAAAGTASDVALVPSNISFFLSSRNEVIQSSSDTLIVTELYDTIINNYGQGASNNLQVLPTAVEGLSFIAVCGTAQAAHYFGFQADTSDKVYLDGVAGSDNEGVQIAVPVVGTCIYWYTFQTGAGAYDWFANTIHGNWVVIAP